MWTTISHKKRSSMLKKALTTVFLSVFISINFFGVLNVGFSSASQNLSKKSATLENSKSMDTRDSINFERRSDRKKDRKEEKTYRSDSDVKKDTPKDELDPNDILGEWVSIYDNNFKYLTGDLCTSNGSLELPQGYDFLDPDPGITSLHPYCQNTYFNTTSRKLEIGEEIGLNMNLPGDGNKYTVKLFYYADTDTTIELSIGGQAVEYELEEAYNNAGRISDEITVVSSNNTGQLPLTIENVSTGFSYLWAVKVSSDNHFVNSSEISISDYDIDYDGDYVNCDSNGQNCTDNGIATHSFKVENTRTEGIGSTATEINVNLAEIVSRSRNGNRDGSVDFSSVDLINAPTNLSYDNTNHNFVITDLQPTTELNVEFNMDYIGASTVDTGATQTIETQLEIDSVQGNNVSFDNDQLSGNVTMYGTYQVPINSSEISISDYDIDYDGDYVNCDSNGQNCQNVGSANHRFRVMNVTSQGNGGNANNIKVRLSQTNNSEDDNIDLSTVTITSPVSGVDFDIDNRTFVIDSLVNNANVDITFTMDYIGANSIPYKQTENIDTKLVLYSVEGDASIDSLNDTVSAFVTVFGLDYTNPIGIGRWISLYDDTAKFLNNDDLCIPVGDLPLPDGYDFYDPDAVLETSQPTVCEDYNPRPITTRYLAHDIDDEVGLQMNLPGNNTEYDVSLWYYSEEDISLSLQVGSGPVENYDLPYGSYTSNGRIRWVTRDNKVYGPNTAGNFPITIKNTGNTDFYLYAILVGAEGQFEPEILSLTKTFNLPVQPRDNDRNYRVDWNALPANKLVSYDIDFSTGWGNNYLDNVTLTDDYTNIINSQEAYTYDHYQVIGLEESQVSLGSSLFGIMKGMFGFRDSELTFNITDVAPDTDATIRVFFEMENPRVLDPTCPTGSDCWVRDIGNDVEITSSNPDQQTLRYSATLVDYYSEGTVGPNESELILNSYNINPAPPTAINPDYSSYGYASQSFVVENYIKTGSGENATDVQVRIEEGTVTNGGTVDLTRIDLDHQSNVSYEYDVINQQGVFTINTLNAGDDIEVNYGLHYNATTVNDPDSLVGTNINLLNNSSVSSTNTISRSVSGLLLSPDDTYTQIETFTKGVIAASTEPFPYSVANSAVTYEIDWSTSATGQAIPQSSFEIIDDFQGVHLNYVSEEITGDVGFTMIASSVRDRYRFIPNGDLPANSSGTITINAVIKEPTSTVTNTTVTNRAHYEIDGVSHGEVRASFEYFYNSPSPLNITKTVTPSVINYALGLTVDQEPFVYDITLTKDGEEAVSNIDVYDLLPEYLNLDTVEITQSSGSFIPGTPIHFTGIDFSAQRTWTATISAYIDPANSDMQVSGTYNVVNNVEVRVDNVVVDSDTATSTINVYSPGVDLYLNKDVTYTSYPSLGADSGTVVTYTLTYGNNGDTTSTEYQVTDTFDNVNLSNITPIEPNSFSGIVDNEIAWRFTDDLPPNSSGIIRFSATVNPTQGTTSILNTAGIESIVPTEPDLNLTNNTDSVTFNVGTDLGITKTANGATFYSGDIIEYTLNYGVVSESLGASGIEIVDTYPSELEIVNANGGLINDNDRTLTWNILGGMQPGDNASFTYTAKVISDIDKNITNNVVISANEYDYNLSNNQDSYQVSINPSSPGGINYRRRRSRRRYSPYYPPMYIPDTKPFTIQKSVNPQTVEAGQEAVYTIHIANTTNTYQSIGFYDSIGFENTGFINGTQGGKVTYIDNSMVVTGATFTGGVNKNTGMTLFDIQPLGNVNITYRVSTSAPDSVVSFVANEAMLFDGTTHSATLVINGKNPVATNSNVSINKFADKEIVDPNDLVEYTLLVTNNGDELAKSVNINDALPYGLKYISSPDRELTNSNGNLTVDLGDLNPGESKRITYFAKVNENVKPGSLIENTARLDYKDVNNNQQPTRYARELVRVGSLAVLAIIIVMIGSFGLVRFIRQFRKARDFSY